MQTGFQAVDLDEFVQHVIVNEVVCLHPKLGYYLCAHKTESYEFSPEEAARFFSSDSL